MIRILPRSSAVSSTFIHATVEAAYPKYGIARISGYVEREPRSRVQPFFTSVNSLLFAQMFSNVFTSKSDTTNEFFGPEDTLPPLCSNANHHCAGLTRLHSWSHTGRAHHPRLITEPVIVQRGIMDITRTPRSTHPILYSKPWVSGIH